MHAQNTVTVKIGAVFNNMELKRTVLKRVDYSIQLSHSFNNVFAAYTCVLFVSGRQNFH